MRDFIILLYLHNGERSKIISKAAAVLQRKRETETERQNKSGREDFIARRRFAHHHHHQRERERERERDSYLVTHDVYLCVVGQKVCGVFDNFEDKKGEEKKESFGESAAQSFGG